MVTERQYLIDNLKKAGIKSQVYTTMKKLEAANEIHLGAVLQSGEKFMRSGSKKKFVDQEGHRKRRTMLWSRDTKFSVIIADSTDEKVEEILEKFLTNIGKGITVDQNWVNIVIGEADWVEEGDSILRSKIAVQFDVTFEGGIYKDSKLIEKDISVNANEEE